MSNIKPNSIITLLNSPEDMQVLLDTSIWVASRLKSAIGLLYSKPSHHRKQAVDYSGCLTPDNEEHLLKEFANEEHMANLTHKTEGKDLLAKAQIYCAEHFCKQSTYPLQRQCSINENLDYIDDKAELIITGRQLTCETTLANIVRHSHCPILVTHSTFKTPESALLAFDNKETCHRLVEWVSKSPLTRNMCIHIVMVGEKNTQNNDAIREAYAKLTQAGIKCKKKLLDCRDITAALLYYQKENNLDMLMSGAFGQSRLREWLQGSNTEKLLKIHQTPYLLLPKR